MHGVTAISAIGIVLLTSATASADNALSPDEIFRRASPSIYMVYSAPSLADIQAKKNIAQGSAVALTTDIAVTNCHVVGKNQLVIFYFEKAATVATVESVNERADICFLKSASLKLQPIAQVRPSSDLSVGERAYAIGNPRGLERTLSEGLVSGLRDQNGIRIVQTSASISPGSSGGGLFDAQGRLIGITTRLIKDEGSLNFAVATNEFWPLPGKLIAAVVGSIYKFATGT